MVAEPPLIGREKELGRLSELLDRAMEGSGKLILLSGEAGIGKTRLAMEFETIASARGCKVLFGACLPSAQIPYLVFLDALNDLFVEKKERNALRTTKIGSAVKKAAPELIKAVPIVGSTAKAAAALFMEYGEESATEQISKEHVLFRALNLLKIESQKMPMIIHLDDLQWADSMSIAMLHFLARNCRDLRVIMVGTYRSEEVLNKESGIHPFLESIRVMKREGLVEEIALRPLGEGQLNQVVTAMLERPIQRMVLERIFKESGGNPLFAVETVRLLANAGMLTLHDGEFVVAGDIVQAIPSSVKEVIIRRIERISKEERRTLDYASVIGMMFEPDLLAESIRRDRILLLETLERLQNDYQLVMEVEPSYIFTHEKIRKITYDSISALRRKEVHRTVGDILERVSSLDRRYGDLSHHFYFAQDGEKCVKYSILAGDEALRQGGAIEAIALFQRALEMGPGTKDFESIKYHATISLGEAYDQEGNTQASLKCYEQCLEMDIKGNQRAKVLRKLAECWAPQRQGKGQKEKSLELCEMASAIPEIDAYERGQIASLLTVIYMQEGDPVEARKQAQMSEDAFREAKTNKELALQLLWNSDIYIAMGEIDTALTKIREAEVLNNQDYNIVTQSEIDFHYGMVFLQRGQVEEAVHGFDANIELSKKIGWESAMSVAYFYESMLMDQEGNFQASLELARESKLFAERIENPYLVAQATAALSHELYKLRHWSECQQYALEANRIKIDSYGPDMRAPMAGTVLLSLADAAMTRDDWEEASRFYSDSIDMFGSVALGKLSEALALMAYSEALIGRGKGDDAKSKLIRASRIFQELGNEKQVKRCEMAMRSLA